MERILEPKRIVRLLLVLAALVCLSVNTVRYVDAEGSVARTQPDQSVHFDFGQVRTKGPRLNLKSAVLINYDNGAVLYAKDADRVRPIASISKLVAAMVVLDKKVDLSRTERITKADAYRSSRSHLRSGYELTLGDLLRTALMISDNRATRALARATCGSIEEFAREMNKKCAQLGLKNTVFYEPTGLDARNVSTAVEVAMIVHYSREYPLISQITSTQRFRVKVQNRKNTYFQLSNTNKLLRSPYKVFMGKTGYIKESEYCLTSLVGNAKGARLTLVVLGAPGNGLRFREARKLIDWGFKQI